MPPKIPGLNPVAMSVAGTHFVEPANIFLILWEGSTTAGDTVRIRHRDESNTMLWPGRTNDTNTYIGANFGPYGVHAPHGFKLDQISSGTVYVYISEE